MKNANQRIFRIFFKFLLINYWSMKDDEIYLFKKTEFNEKITKSLWLWKFWFSVFDFQKFFVTWCRKLVDRELFLPIYETLLCLFCAIWDERQTRNFFSRFFFLIQKNCFFFYIYKSYKTKKKKIKNRHTLTHLIYIKMFHSKIILCKINLFFQNHNNFHNSIHNPHTSIALRHKQMNYYCLSNDFLLDSSSSRELDWRLLLKIMISFLFLLSEKNDSLQILHHSFAIVICYHCIIFRSFFLSRFWKFFQS